MIQALLLLGCVLLSPVAAFPRNVHNDALTLQSDVTETELPNMLSSRIPPPDPSTCRNLLHTVPSLAPLPEHLSNLALMVALEDMGCLTEARRLQLQLFRTEGKDAIETLIRESQKHKKEGGISNIKFIPKNLGGSSGGIKRAQRSVALPEACTSEYGWVFYETALVMIEFVDKLPPTDLIREFKASAVNVTQQCTSESWDHLLEVGQTLTESPELDKATISVEDQIHFVIRITDILKRILVAFVQKYFEIYFG